ncbi:unnamed protein product [Pieris macdunnoughi]|uniref:Uncharacterized protein n=1 Tax=Pieris macdunnoughi TaxID=345717 RepID=A0A821W2C0_9NEOP|nr:unnamed protein product [Pieris macdunnoughi]
MHLFWCVEDGYIRLIDGRRIDGSVILWEVRDLNSKEHRNIRVNIEFDYASHIAWSPDSKGFVVHTVQENHIMGYKVEKKKDLIVSVSHAISFDKPYSEFIKLSLTVVLLKNRATKYRAFTEALSREAFDCVHVNPDLNSR